MVDSRMFGDYRVIKQIGQGSLGTVYLAEHHFMKKPYVLKVLPEELSSDRSFVQRLEEDVSVLASLDHPNIVKIHNVSFAQGQYFLVTDCVVDELGETTNLAQYMLSRHKRLEEEEIYNLLKQIADSLQYAHNKKGNGKGIPHRTLKLNNILVGRGKEGETSLFLSDFGLSRIIGIGAVLTRTYLATAEALGISTALAAAKSNQGYSNTPIDSNKLPPLHQSFIQNFAFLAPEQKKLDPQNPVDTKADIYAFGVLAYYLLSREFPEGFFDMPSKISTDYKWNWDSLIQNCLLADPIKRPEKILDVLEGVRKKANHNPKVLDEALDRLAETSESYSQESEEFAEPIESSMANETSQKTVHANGPQAATLRPVLRVTQLERPRTDLDPAATLRVDPTVKYYVPERKEVRNIQPLLTDMIVVDGGEFFRGSNDGNRDEVPRHQISINSFAIDIHPVTNDQFVRFLDAMGGEKDSNHHDIIRLRDSRIKRSGGKLTIESGYARHPVVGVTWYGAVAYAKWIGKRLPTEAEWEIASYGSLENALYQTGDDIEKTQANFFSSDTTPVMSYAPNGYGLYDMSGNVYEWCHDWYGYNYYEISVQEPDDPKGPLQGVYRVLRGGCWKSLKEDLRCSRRHRNNPGTVNSTYGFRCAADVQ
jgi:formylglycine-generating enzyme required for sulfatase activity